MCTAAAPPQLRQFVLEIVGSWACLCESDERWAARSRGEEAIRNPNKCHFVALMRKYIKVGLTIPLPPDPPRRIADIAAGPGGRRSGTSARGQATARPIG